MTPQNKHTEKGHTRKKLLFTIISNIEVDHDPQAFSMNFEGEYNVDLAGNYSNTHIFNNEG